MLKSLTIIRYFKGTLFILFILCFKSSMVLCKPENILGKAGTGAVLSLDAIGLQDTHLTGTDDSFFQFKNKRHTPLTKYSAARVFVNPGQVNGWPFGQTIKFQMNPRTMGDLLSNMYLKFKLPPGNYCSDYLGWAMINQIEFRIDSQVIETIKGDWNVVYSQLHYLIEEQRALDQLFQGGSVENASSMYIPFNFFFNRRHGTQDTGNPLIHDSYFKPYFLTCAAYGNKEITVSITFNPTTFFTSDGHCTLGSVTLVTDELVIGDAERAFIVGNKQAQVISCVGNNPVATASSSPFNINLTPNVPVKTLHWFFRDTRYENSENSTYYQNRYNFSSNIFCTDATETMSPIVGETQFYLNGQQVLGVAKSTSVANRQDGSYYYKFAQPLNHNLTVPQKNIYSYSFCLRPKDPAPSGAVNFSQLDSDTTKLTGSFYHGALGPTYSINVFYTGYHEIIYDQGFVSLKYAGS
jgi:hypothetical protein